MLKSTSLIGTQSIGSRMVLGALIGAIASLGFQTRDVTILSPVSRSEVDDQENGYVALGPGDTATLSGGLKLSQATVHKLRNTAFSTREVETHVTLAGLEFPRKRTVAMAWAFKTEYEDVVMVYADRVGDTFVVSRIEASNALTDAGPREVHKRFDGWEHAVRSRPVPRKSDRVRSDARKAA